MPSFKPAKRANTYQRVVLIGPSGAGKTWSALELAAHSGRSVGLISFEGPPPRPCDWQAVYDFNQAIGAIQEAKKAGIGALVVDCLSSLWNGPKGLLSNLDRFDDKKAWALIRQDLELLWECLASYPGHVFCTVRAEEIRVVVEREGQHRVLSLPGKVAFQGDVGSHFDVSLEMQGGVADCKKGPPSCYNRLFPFPGPELAGILFASGSQASPPAPEVSSPLEAVPEIPIHPSEPPPAVASPPGNGGISTPPLEPRLSGGSLDSEDPSAITIKRLRQKGQEVAGRGAARKDIRHAFTANNGEFNEAGELVGLPTNRREYCWGQLEELALAAEKQVRS